MLDGCPLKKHASVRQWIVVVLTPVVAVSVHVVLDFLVKGTSSLGVIPVRAWSAFKTVKNGIVAGKSRLVTLSLNHSANSHTHLSFTIVIEA
jgi:hypothetical protein